MIPSLLSISLICGCIPSLSVIESLEDSSGKGFLDVLDGSGLANGGISITSGLGGEGGGEGGLEVDEEFVFVHVIELVGGDGGDGGDGEEFHLLIIKNYLLEERAE